MAIKTSLKKLLVWGSILSIGSVAYLVLVYITALVLSQSSVMEMLISITPKSKLSGENILVYGVDNTKGVKRSDAILLLHLDNTANSVGVLSIPRDTLLTIPGRGEDKINHAYAYGGKPLLKSTVESFLKLPVDYTLQINLGGIKKLIDAIGGVEIDVEKDMYYIDRAGDLYIDLKKGRQLLNGEKAIQYLRFRNDYEGDIGRIKRQQLFIKQLARKLIKTNKLHKIPKTISLLKQSIKTDLPYSKLLGLTLQFKDAHQHGTIKKAIIPGNSVTIKGVSYWRPHSSEFKTVLETLYITNKEQAIKQAVEKENEAITEELLPPVLITSKKESYTPKPKRKPKNTKPVKGTYFTEELTGDSTLVQPITVEVLTSIKALAIRKKIKNRLGIKGVTIKSIREVNAQQYPHTLIIDWKNNQSAIIPFARQLRIDPSRIIVYDKPEKNLDSTLIIGEDWKTIVEGWKQ